MKQTEASHREFQLFDESKDHDIAILRFNENLLFNIQDLEVRDILLDYFDAVSQDSDVKVVVIIPFQESECRLKYMQFYKNIIANKYDQNAIYRLYNVINQIYLKITSLNKLVVHAISGKVMCLFMNLSLACDYRIAAENTIFQNCYLDLGLLPKGGSPYFLARRVGLGKAYEILLLREEITAEEACEWGIINKVVPDDHLEKSALTLARRFAQRPARTIEGLKRLLHFSKRDLKDYLEFENQELLKIIEPHLWA
jgi:enoyl-CoA hydratase/carnithine racemase